MKTDYIPKPFFINDIEGFSLEEHMAPGHWYNDTKEGFWAAWEWKGPVINQSGCAYGKFLRGKAMYVSSKWFPDFANVRRDGYDFDARYEDGLASFDDKELYELLDANAPILSRPLKRMGNYRKGGRKGFDSAITRLQKQCYVLISDFRYAEDKFGNEYGWGIAEYSTPEKFLGKAGFALTHSSRMDLVLEYCIKERIYDVIQINEVLFDLDLPLLGNSSSVA